ncbi:hypothetical protein ASC75_24885 [Aminobacter sp. DSM 101952]|nr:hypothetical protein ASC75_24885 [Aminobacter sp. DSM 101952]
MGRRQDNVWTERGDLMSRKLWGRRTEDHREREGSDHRKTIISMCAARFGFPSRPQALVYLR